MNTEETEPDAMAAVKMLFWFAVVLVVASRCGCFPPSL